MELVYHEVGSQVESTGTYGCKLCLETNAGAPMRDYTEGETYEECPVHGSSTLWISAQDQSRLMMLRLESLIGEENLSEKVKAELLLKMCRFLFQVDQVRYRKYFTLLMKLSGRLDAKSRDDYTDLAKLYSLGEKPLSGSFGRLFQARQAAMAEMEDADRIEAELIALDEMVRKRWWMPGKTTYRFRLLRTWMAINREQAIKKLRKFPTEIKLLGMKILRQQHPFTGAEWEMILIYNETLRPTIVEQIDLSDENQLTLSLAKKLGTSILDGLFTKDPDGEYLQYSPKSVDRYLDLVIGTYRIDPEYAKDMMITIHSKVIKHDFSNEWNRQFALCNRFLNLASGMTEIKEQFFIKIVSNAEQYWQPFLRSHWGSRNVQTLEEAEIAFQVLMEYLDKQEKDPKVDRQTLQRETAEMWFFMMLFSRDLDEIAMDLAQKTGHYERHKARFRRAILLSCPNEKIREYITEKEIEPDSLERLLFYNLSERVDYLRNLTNRGTISLPKKIWKQPDMDALINDDHDDVEKTALISWFLKNEEKSNWFSEYLRMNGYGEYTHTDVDSILFQTLVEWDRLYPDEVPQLIGELWKEMAPTDFTVKTDIFRRHVIERCRTVFSARPELLDSLLIKWLKTTLVDKSLSWTIGNNTYTLHFDENLPLQYALICAETWGGISMRKRGELVLTALKNYRANPQWVEIAAGIYASDKGLAALEPPLPLKKDLRSAWQIGVIKQSDGDVYRPLFEQTELTV